MRIEEAKERIKAMAGKGKGEIARQREQFNQRLEEQVAEIRRQHQAGKASR